RERGQGVGHAVDRLRQGGDLTLCLEGELAPQVAVGDRGHNAGDTSHLVGEVAGHRVDVVGEVLPDTADALHLGLAAELAFGAHLTGDARDLGCEGVQLVDHRVDGVFLDEELAERVDGDLLGEVAHGDRGGHICDVAGPIGEVHVHGVDVVGQVFPDAADSLDVGLAAELAFGPDLVGHTRDLAGQC